MKTSISVIRIGELRRTLFFVLLIVLFSFSASLQQLKNIKNTYSNETKRQAAEVYVVGESNLYSYKNLIYFSQTGGYYTSPFYLKINSSVGHQIFYTTNGSLPTLQSIIYQDSLKD